MGYVASMPLFLTAGAAAGSWALSMGVHALTGREFEVSFRAVLVCLAGALYANLFEHGWHRYAMHSRRPDPHHATHHRVFYGKGFQTRDPDALREVVTAAYIFPILLAIHYPLFMASFPAGLAPAFFLGVVLHFVSYEVTHWYTHVADNAFDRCVRRIPGLCRLREAQIRHHRLHHADPTVNFNFNPPYAGDRIGNVFRR
jgi:hypothetical protein